MVIQIWKIMVIQIFVVENLGDRNTGLVLLKFGFSTLKFSMQLNGNCQSSGTSEKTKPQKSKVEKCAENVHLPSGELT